MHEIKTPLLRRQFLLATISTFILSSPWILHIAECAPSPQEGDVQLVITNDFSAADAGNVLIYHDGRWGAICDDGWSLSNAKVVCKMLGYPNAFVHTKEAYFGTPTEEYWMDNVRCTGNEARIQDCRSNAWGQHDCVKAEAAGVYCVPKPAPPPGLPATSTPEPETTTPSPTSAPRRHHRLHNAESTPRPQAENNLRADEIQPVVGHRNNVEESIHTPTPQQVNQNDIQFGETTRSPPVTPNRDHTQRNSNQRAHDNSPSHIRSEPVDHHNDRQVNEINAHARGDNHNIRSHHHSHSHNPTAVPVAPENEALPPTASVHLEDIDTLQNDAVMDAILTMEDKFALDRMAQEKKFDLNNLPEYKLSIIGGRNKNEGYIHIVLDDHHEGTICSDGWGLREALVVCRQLKLHHAQSAVTYAAFGASDKDKIISGIKCKGNEEHLSKCTHGQLGKDIGCSDKMAVAGVICTHALPDLVPNATLLQHSTYLQDRQLFYLQCAMEEGCASSSAYTIKNSSPNWFRSTRRLLRFTSSTWNFGTADFRPFRRKEDWEWHQCHMHYHSMEVFASYDLLDKHGNRIAEGHKASFCLEDIQCLPGRNRKYVCAGFGEQGISVGCADDYLHEIDCQWIDISDVAPGEYIFQVHVNPSLFVAELNYENNLAQCDLSYTGTSVNVRNCVIVNDGFT